MAERRHQYRVDVRWAGDTGSRNYTRDGEIVSSVSSKPAIPASADPAFRGSPSRWNPEELYVASISTCHKLSYLYLCATAGIAVTAYVDHAEGVMVVGGGSGRFESVTLKPAITLTRKADIERATALHHDAHTTCFIANSIATPVTVEPVFIASDDASG